MSAPPKIIAGATRRLELHMGEFAIATYHMKAGDIGELFQMLMAEVGCMPIASASNEVVAEAWSKRDRYRRVKGSFGRRGLSLAVRAAVFARDGGKCRYCDVSLTWDTYECDHVHPVSKGGADALSNLAAACTDCNRRKGGKTLKEWMAAP